MASQQMLAAVAPSPVPSPAAKKKTTAIDKVNLGFIGLGQQAMNLLNGFIGMDGFRVVCGCDVYDIKRNRFVKRVTDFYTGKGAEEEILQDAETESYKAEKTRKQAGKPVFYRDAGESEKKKDKTDQAPDFSQWETELKETEQESSLQPEQKSVSVTSAGYVVPEDSPYRRPVNKISAERSPETEKGQNDFPENRKSREEPLPIMPRRRKRINVTELFADPEEEIRQFDAPQHVIDSNKAYRDPVYPRGWKKSEDDGE